MPILSEKCPCCNQNIVVHVEVPGIAGLLFTSKSDYAKFVMEHIKITHVKRDLPLEIVKGSI